MIPVPANEQKIEPSNDTVAIFDVVLVSRTVAINNNVETGFMTSSIIEHRYKQIPKGLPWMPVEIQPVN